MCYFLQFMHQLFLLFLQLMQLIKLTDEIDMGYPWSMGEQLLISKELSKFKADCIVLALLLEFCFRGQILHKYGKVGISGLSFIVVPPGFSEMISHIYQGNQKGDKTANPQYMFFSSQVQIDGGKENHKT